MAKIGDIELGEFPLLLAPMEDVSDPPFRALCKEQGADVVYTEFISSEGLIRDAAKSIQKLDIYESERPVGIQIFGANLKLDLLGNCEVYLRNIGGKDVPMEVIEFYVAEVGSDEFREIDFTTPTKTLEKYDIAKVSFKLQPKKYKLVVRIYDNTMDIGFLTCLPFSCEIKPFCGSHEEEIIALSGTTNAYVELPTEGNYNQKLCCSQVSNVTYQDSNCNPGFTGFFALSTNSSFDQNTNCVLEKYNLSSSEIATDQGFDYKKNVCVDFAKGNINCNFTASSNCLGAAILSLSGITNARAGNITSYPNVICCSYS